MQATHKQVESTSARVYAVPSQETTNQTNTKIRSKMKTKMPTPSSSPVAPLHQEVLQSLKWNVTHSLVVPAREGRWTSPDALGLSSQGLQLALQDPRGIYEHQELALREIVGKGRDTAVTTGTGSGKSLIFQVGAVDTLARDPRACVLVLYPMRALAEEQYDRWVRALAASGVDAGAALFIGQGLTVKERLKAISKSRLIVSTPDVVHAWLMQYRTREKSIRSFLQRLKLLVVDEAHSYTAVFGSQSAFLFRRLDHAVRGFGHKFQVVAASATMADPADHLYRLTGRNCTVIGAEHDSSPAHAKTVHFVSPGPSADLISGLGAWFRRCADTKAGQFLAFVESRVQAEHFARVAGRRATADEDVGSDAASSAQTVGGLETAAGGAVHAYRSGFDATYRRELVNDLRTGRIAGLVSTSALELGMDLPDLALGFLVGAPRSSTSLMQRLGRFGRHCPASIFIIADGSTASVELFAAPESLMRLPLQTSSLYLDNPRIQYIHVLCHSREENWAEMENPPAAFASDVEFPKGFVELCTKELRGESVADLKSLRPAGDEAPHLAFPLRDCDLQFVVKEQNRGFSQQLGTLTFAQVLREAYPGAVYFHASRPYRVRQIQVNRRTVLVEQCRTAFSKPKSLPPVLQPDLSSDAVLSWVSHDRLSVVETQMQARECVSGFTERQGAAVREVVYPMSEGDPSGAAYANPRFCRHIETTGVLLSHPALKNDSVRVGEIADVILEAMLLLVPIERQDIASGVGRVRVDRNGLSRADRFVALYDRTYGSLRLSGRLTANGTLREVLQRSVVLAESGLIADTVTLGALRAMSAASGAPAVVVPDTDEIAHTALDLPSGTILRVIKPGSFGVNLGSGAVFQVGSVFYAPDGIRYRGRYDHQKQSDLLGHIAADQIGELAGETEWATFDLATGELASVPAAIA